MSPTPLRAWRRPAVRAPRRRVPQTVRRAPGGPLRSRSASSAFAVLPAAAWPKGSADPSRSGARMSGCSAPSSRRPPAPDRAGAGSRAFPPAPTAPPAAASDAGARRTRRCWSRARGRPGGRVPARARSFASRCSAADEVRRDEAVDRVVVEASARRLLAQHLAADPAGGDEPVAEPLAERALGRDVRAGDLGHAAVVVRGERGVDVAGRQQVLHADRAGIGRELVPQPPAHHLQLQGLDVEAGLAARSCRRAAGPRSSPDPSRALRRRRVRTRGRRRVPASRSHPRAASTVSRSTRNALLRRVGTSSRNGSSAPR